MAPHVRIRLEQESDREAIYRLRHDVYAEELGQHSTRPEARLTDRLDDVNTYVVAEINGAVAGFASITPPNPRGYSVDKYLPRASVPVAFDAGLYELRILTVARPFRGQGLGNLLMLAAFEYIEARGGTTLIAIGRIELVPTYQRFGMKGTGIRFRSGQVEFELMHAAVADVRRTILERLQRETLPPPGVEWPVFARHSAAFHGGRAYERIGDGFEHMLEAPHIVAADVLDAPFPPARRVVETLRENLAWVLRTSPPIQAAGLERAIATARGLPPDAVLAGPGSSALIHLAFRRMLTPESRVLILEPTYSEYPHLLDSVIACRVHRFRLDRADNFDLPIERLRREIVDGAYDWVVLVNPNNPTGRHVPSNAMKELVDGAPPATRFWIDETYIDYAGPGQTLEGLAASSSNVVVCKSMSKAYALSGARVAYLCGPRPLLAELRGQMPPWSIPTPTQWAAIAALDSSEYYSEQWKAAMKWSRELAKGLRALGIVVLDSRTPYHLCRLPPESDPHRIVEACAAQGIYFRRLEGMGAGLDAYDVRIATQGPEGDKRLLRAVEQAIRATSRPLTSPAPI